MKKIFKSLLLLPVLLGAVACGGNNQSNNGGTSTGNVNNSTGGSNTSTNVTEKWKVEYLYNFEGSAGVYETQYILNGEKAVKPMNNPKREGFFKFDGWYKDSYCIMPFDFATETIVGPTSIYAGWLELEDPSLGFDITWTQVEGVEYVSLTEDELPTHVEANEEVSFKLNIADTHEGAPIVKANDTVITAADGVYTLKVNTKTTINVTGVKLKEEIDDNQTPVVPTEFFIKVNGTPVGQMTLNSSTMVDVQAEYMLSVDLVEDDVVVIVDSTDKEYKNWENGGEFIANSPVIIKTPGTYTFYLKIYESRISIWIEKPTPTPDPNGEYYRLTFTLPSGWSPAATNPRLHYWGSANTESLGLFNLGAKSNMTLLEGSTYYIDIDTSITLEGMIIIFDQGSEVKQSFDMTPTSEADFPVVPGVYDITVPDWGANGWKQNDYGVWCFVATLTAM